MRATRDHSDPLSKSKLEEAVETLEALSKAEPSLGKGAKMKMSEVGTPTDPLREIQWPITGLPEGAKVWSSTDPLRQMHHVTLDYQGMQYNTSVTHAVLAEAVDVHVVATAIVQDLLDQAGIKDEEDYKAIKLSWWQWLINDLGHRPDR